jgi:hypothetical protein
MIDPKREFAAGVYLEFIDWGPPTDEHLPHSPFTGQFLWMTTFFFVVFIVN